MAPIDRLREQAVRRRGPQTLPPPMPPVPTDAAFYADLPDLLQAQLYVALQTYNRKRTPQMPEERLLWAGTPHTRVRTMLLIFVVWVLIMFLPAFYLVEEVDEFGPPRPDQPIGGCAPHPSRARHPRRLARAYLGRLHRLPLRAAHLAPLARRLRHHGTRPPLAARARPLARPPRAGEPDGAAPFFARRRTDRSRPSGR